jgi:hypothetical protein
MCDNEMANNAKLIKTPKDFPEGLAKNRKHHANYFSGHSNPAKGMTSKVRLKV